MELHAAIRASQIPEWADCQARADYHVKRNGPEIARPHVGAVLGTIVHTMLLERHEDAFDNLPEFVEWDQWTRNERDLRRQAGALYDLARHEMARREYGILFSEVTLRREIVLPPVRLLVTGHMDAVIEHDATRGLASFELKTGAHQPKAAWLQTGVYAWLWEGKVCAEPSDLAEKNNIRTSVVMWLNRRNERILWHERETEPLRFAATRQILAIARSMSQGVTYNPSSLACSSCLVDDCPVRYEGGLTSVI